MRTPYRIRNPDETYVVEARATICKEPRESSVPFTLKPHRTHHKQHDVAPWFAWKDPCGHGVHICPAPGVSEKYPGGHGVGDVFP